MLGPVHCIIYHFIVAQHMFVYFGSGTGVHSCLECSSYVEAELCIIHWRRVIHWRCVTHVLGCVIHQPANHNTPRVLWWGLIHQPEHRAQLFLVVWNTHSTPAVLPIHTHTHTHTPSSALRWWPVLRSNGINKQTPMIPTFCGFFPDLKDKIHRSGAIIWRSR